MAELNLKYHRLLDVLALLAGASLFTYVLIRAINVPITPEEADLFMNHNARGNLFISDLESAGNLQLLNILLIQLSTAVLGISEWVIRLPNVLSIAIYLYFSYLIISKHPLYIRLIFWPALWSIPILIEMFGLGLGYGISIAFLIMALNYVYSFLSKGSIRSFYWAQFSILASILANAQLYFPAALISIILFIKFLNVKKDWLHLFAGLIILLALTLEGRWAFEVLSHAAKHKLPDFESLIESTFKPLYRAVFYRGFVAKIHVSYFLVVGIFMLYCYVLSIAKNGLFRSLRSRELMFFHMFILMVLSLMATKYYFGIMLPDTENLVFLIPVLLLSIAGLADFHVKGSFSLVTTLVGMMLIFLFPVQLLGRLNLNKAQHWGKRSIKDSYFETVDFLGKNALISGPEYLQSSWAYHNLKSNGDYNLLQWSDFPSRIADVIIWDAQSENENINYYDTLDAYPESKSFLLKRIRSIPFDTVISYDSLNTDSIISDEFRNLIEYQVVELRSNVMRIDIEAEIMGSSVPFDAEIVVSVENDSATAVIYERYPLSWHHSEWEEEQSYFDHSIYLKELPQNSAILKVYIWNPDQVQYQVSGARITLLKYSFESIN
jgi:hypothetical protein